jgi:hypothetical protein
VNRFLAMVAASGVLVLAGCTSEQPVMSLSDLPHAHNVVVVDGEVYVGTHHGFYEFSEENGFVLRSKDFDVMGLAAADGVFFASGHPGQGFPFPDPVGLLESSDRGQSWQAVSLTGDVDFHRLDAVGEVMVGAAANYGVTVMSTDRGASWGSVDWPEFNDFAINPNDARHIVLATSQGLALSTNGGELFERVADSAPALIVDWSMDGLTVVEDGQVLAGTEPGQPLVAVYVGIENPIDLARSGATIAVLDGHSLLVSRDSGTTFRRY